MYPDLDAEKVKKAVLNYCDSHGLSLAKIRTQWTQQIDDKVYFLQDNGVEPDGLRNDLDTVPYPTLIVNADYEVLETDYTNKYLKS